MSSVPKPAAAVKGRTIRLVCGPTATYPYAVLEVRAGRKSTYYAVCPTASDFGDAYKFRKLTRGEPVIHETCIESPSESWCDCKGFEHSGDCRHLAALREVGSRLPDAFHWPLAAKSVRRVVPPCCTPETDGRLCDACRAEYEGWLREVSEQMPPADGWQEDQQYNANTAPEGLPF